MFPLIVENPATAWMVDNNVSLDCRKWLIALLTDYTVSLDCRKWLIALLTDKYVSHDCRKPRLQVWERVLWLIHKQVDSEGAASRVLLGSLSVEDGEWSMMLPLCARW